MFVVKCDEERYEYDIHSLVKAFFAEEQVSVVTSQTAEAKRAELLPLTQIEIIMKPEEGAEVSFTGGEYYTWSYQGSTSQRADESGNINQDTEKSSDNQKSTYKDEFKIFLYKTLSKETGLILPWGNLTGIRPTKIAYGMLEEGKSDQEILDFYKEKHLVSDEKAELSIDIAKRERKLLATLHFDGGYSLYIGIPFCPSTCLYCSFTSFAIGAYKKFVEEYIDCVLKEAAFTAEFYKDKILDTVYIGGGTPTTLEADQLDRLISGVKALFDFSTVQEFTVEAGRADSITREKLEVLKKHDVTRISVNPQTFKQETLDIIGRRATVVQTIEAYKLTREVGFDNINMDIILGLPGEDEETVTQTIEKIKELAPDSLTVHSLAIKRASRLSQWIKEHGVTALNNTDATMEIAAAGAKALDLKPYYLYRQKNMSGNFENVGYAKEGKLGIYNILIMEEQQTIVALGAGTITKRVFPGGRIERCDTVKDVRLYIEQIDEMIERKRQLLGE